MVAPETERCDEGDIFDEADATFAVAVAKGEPVPARDALAASDSSGVAEKLPSEERDTMELGDLLPAADTVAMVGVADCVELGRGEPETDGASEALNEGRELRLGSAGEPVPAELAVASAVSEVVGRADALAERAADCVELGRGEPETDGASEALNEGRELRLGSAGEPVPAELAVASAVSEVVGRADALAERAPEELAEKTGLPLGSGEPDL